MEEKIFEMGAKQLAAALHAAISRLGQLGREGAAEFNKLVTEDDIDFSEGVGWIDQIIDGDFKA